MAFLNGTKYSRVLLAGIIALMLLDFIARGIAPAFTAGKNDFSDPYVGAWLWRHGKNPYDVALASSTGKLLTRSQMPVVPIYPPTTFVLVTPLSLLPWGWANFVWALLGVGGVGVIAFALARMGDFGRGNIETWLVVAVVFAFAPLHTSIHVANGAVITVALCLLGVYLARHQHDLASGVVLTLATGIKPQLGIWILAFYLVRRRWRIVAASVLSGALLAETAIARIPLTPRLLFANYSNNLRYWFGPGGQNDFSAANPLRFQLVNLQVVLYRLVGDSVTANALAYAVFALGLATWTYAVFRRRTPPEALALSSLLALSFVPIYHRVYDVGILTLALCWALGEWSERLRNVRRATVVLLLLFLAPGQALLARSEPYLSSRVTNSWWWNLILGPHAVWVLLALNIVLLCALVIPACSPPNQEPSSSERLVDTTPGS